LFPPGEGRKKSVCVYNGLLSSQHNERVLTAFNEDLDTLVVVATIKFGMGIDVRGAEVVVNVGLPATAEDDLQQKGRAGRMSSVDACGITYVEPGIVQSAQLAIRAGAQPEDYKSAASARLVKSAGENIPCELVSDNTIKGCWKTLDPNLQRLHQEKLPLLEALECSSC